MAENPCLALGYRRSSPQTTRHLGNAGCHTDNYWQVYFDTNRLIAQTFGEAGYAAPFTVERKTTA